MAVRVAAPIPWRGGGRRHYCLSYLYCLSFGWKPVILFLITTRRPHTDLFVAAVLFVLIVALDTLSYTLALLHTYHTTFLVENPSHRILTRQQDLFRIHLAENILILIKYRYTTSHTYNLQRLFSSYRRNSPCLLLWQVELCPFATSLCLLLCIHFSGSSYKRKSRLASATGSGWRRY